MVGVSFSFPGSGGAVVSGCNSAAGVKESAQASSAFLRVIRRSAEADRTATITWSAEYVIKAIFI